MRAAGEFASLLPAAPLLNRAPRGDGHHVVVLPGFTASDASTVPLRRFLERQGWVAHGWGLGRNLGFAALVHQLDDFLAHALERAGGPVSLVGWSLGGVMARRLAKRYPSQVRRLVMLGSPITGSPTDTAVFRTYDRFMPGRREEIEARYSNPDLLAPAPGVPSTSIWSRTDGVVPWQIAREQAGPLTENVEVQASHLGLGVNPAVFYAVADRLAQGSDPWQRFTPPRILRGLITPGR
ncbi:MAG TPA: alpha/beta fold hydrolase [Pseudomonadales bacterium]|nr:alpha/beta fold hydrolase [Pseudomonadales bacterium]